MKTRSIIYATLIAAAALLATACSNIDPEDRFNYVKPADVARAVLIEDFTGQRCSNCPKGTETINQIVEAYGEQNVIAVGIHSGPLGFAGNSRNIGLATDEGEAYYDKWDKERKLGQPWVLFNRNTAPNGDVNTWMAPVNEAIAKPAVLSITLGNTYDEVSRQLTISTDVFGTSGNHDGKLQLWLIEDGITAMQTMGNGSVNREYVHNHVFRTSVNGTWGEDIKVREGEHSTATHSYTIPEGWNADNMAVVAFVYDDNEVMQVAKLAVKAKAEAE